MASELTISISTSLSRTNITHTRSIVDQADVSTDPMMDKVQNIGTSEESVDFGDVTAGFVVLQNLDDTNFVQFGKTTGVYTGRMKAGEPAIFRMDGTTLFLKADTAACDVRITAYGAS